jgi:hypothetical protein
MRLRRLRLWPFAVLAALLACGCSDENAADAPVAEASSAAAPDPAPPDPAPPDPAPPDPAAADPEGVEAAERAEAAQAAASVTVSPIAVACDDVVAALTDAVLSYEVVALAEGGGGGDRLSAAAEMRTAWSRAREAADVVGAGLPAAAAPALAAVTALHDGLGTRATLDESDADAWREAREGLQDWCRAQG